MMRGDAAVDTPLLMTEVDVRSEELVGLSLRLPMATQEPHAYRAPVPPMSETLTNRWRGLHAGLAAGDACGLWARLRRR